MPWKDLNSISLLLLKICQISRAWQKKGKNVIIFYKLKLFILVKSLEHLLNDNYSARF